MNQYWPVSIIYPKLPVLQDIPTIAAIILLAYALWKTYTKAKPIFVQIIIIWCLTFATNLLQGIDEGFNTPVSPNRAYGFGYWEDAAGITNPINFFTNYTTVQSNLGYHGRVHPPLPTLVTYSLRLLSSQRIIHSLLLSFLCFPTIWFVFDWLRRYIPSKDAQFVAIIIGCLPAFQIFSLSSIDAVICMIFIATLWAYDHPYSSIQLYGTVIGLTLSFLFTFGAVWLIPIMAVMAITKHNVQQAIKIAVLTICIFVLIHATTGYSYLTGFLIAKKYEYSSLFTWTYAGMLSFISSRIMDIMEPIIFMGPYIFWLLISAINQVVTACKPILKKQLRYDEPIIHLGLISISAICSFVGFIAFGAYYTGETSRAALYIVPPILLILGPYLSARHVTLRDQKTLFIVTITQTVLMQLFFNHMY